MNSADACAGAWLLRHRQHRQRSRRNPVALYRQRTDIVGAGNERDNVDLLNADLAYPFATISTTGTPSTSLVLSFNCSDSCSEASSNLLDDLVGGTYERETARAR